MNGGYQPKQDVDRGNPPKGKKVKKKSKKIYNKVYCKDCKYSAYSDTWGFSDSWCHKVIGTIDTPQLPRDIHASPEKHNKHNNCKHYERKIPIWKRIAISLKKRNISLKIIL